eukprot:scaffold294478_cov35-Tisochrysis_lutea.AAC.1
MVIEMPISKIEVIAEQRGDRAREKNERKLPEAQRASHEQAKGDKQLIGQIGGASGNTGADLGCVDGNERR